MTIHKNNLRRAAISWVILSVCGFFPSHITETKLKNLMKTKLTSSILALAFVSCGIANAEPGEGKGKKGTRGERPVPQEILEKYDTDKDGKLSPEERKAAGAARKAEMLAKFDKDGDGKLDKEERKAAGEARKAEMMAKFDTDGNGELSDEEKAEMRKAMPPRGKKGEKGGKKGGKGKKAAPAE